MPEKRNTKKKIVLAICLVTIVFVGVLASFAYIAGLGNNIEDPFKSNLSMGNMALTFSDGDNGINAKLGFGETVTKRFVIENTGSLETSLSLDWDNFVNTYLDRSLSYSLSYSETEDGAYTKIVEETNMPTSPTPVSRPLASELSVPAGKTYYYNLDITLNNLDDVDQTSDLSAQFTTEFNVGQPKKYRYYTLKVDMNGGVWQEFTSPQEYQLKNDETLEIPDPTRDGYTFTGWSIDGVSSELNGNTFSMGISNSTLTANWTVNKYTVSIDGRVEEVDYNSSIELTTPTKEGYTFTGWNTSGGTLDGNTFTLTEAKDITITSTFVVNNYKYIVYHNQMNTSGNGYTLVSADTDEGEAAFGSTISPETKTYQGFTAPNKQTLTIRVDNSNPPTLNVVNYNYDRNRYTLTIDPNGGTYTGSTSLDLYYGASTTINTPSKVGYNFTNWTNTGSGSISGTTYTMGIGNSTLRANYTPKTYSVTFNANGGVTTTESKTVTFDSTYGDLPTPTYSGYRFLGWFTAATGGTEVVSSTQVSLTSNQTLFAHWEKTTVTVTLDAGKGYFGSSDIKTKTIELDPNGTYGELTRPNLDFSSDYYGYYTEKSGGTKINSNTPITNKADHTLYAHWEVCFLADTLIYTPNGYKNIQDIESGDKVYSYNEETEEVEIDEVTQLISHETNVILEALLEDQTMMYVTGNHRFYDPISKDWRRIDSFKVGEYVQNNLGDKVKIKSLIVKEGDFKVYNFEVKNNHNYFVTRDNILTHNVY